MKSEFLKSLGIDDQSIINQIMAENGKDIAREQGKASTLETKVTTLTNDLAERDKTIAGLKKLEGSDATIANLNKQIETLKADAATAKTKYDSDIKGVKLGYLADEYLREKGASSVKLARALIDMDKLDIGEDGKLTGLDEQLTALAETDDYKRVFASNGMRGITPASGGGDPTSTTTQKTLAEVIAAKLNK